MFGKNKKNCRKYNRIGRIVVNLLCGNAEK